jgi:LCP family protein required for cell wall assembly
MIESPSFLNPTPIKKSKYWKKILIFFLRFFAGLFIIGLPLISAAFAGFIIFKTYALSTVISKTDYLWEIKKEAVVAPGEENPQEETKTRKILSQAKQLLGVKSPEFEWGEKERLNILLLGRASEDYPGSQLTDTIMLLSVNPKTNQSALLSLPRDLFVKIPETKQFTKLNAVYHYGTLKDQEKGGIKYLGQTVKDITGQHVDYFVMLDFKGFSKLIDSIGGASVTVQEDLIDTLYPGPNYSYQTFEIKKGTHLLDGETALKYVRTRHNSGGDFGRAFRQQQVLSAIKNKFFSLEGVSLLAKAGSISEAITENVITDIPFSEYGSFIALAKNVNTYKITNKVIDNRGENPILSNYSPYLGGVRAYFLRPTLGNYSQIQDIAKNIFDLPKLETAFAKRKTEAPRILCVNRSKKRNLLKETKEKFIAAGFMNIETREEDESALSTSVIDQTEGLKPYSLDFVVKTLDASLEESGSVDNASGFDFIVVLGNNLRESTEDEEVILPKEAFSQEDY